MEYALTLNPQHLSLHFDGLRISKSAIADADSFVEQSQLAILRKTGYHVSIMEKRHFFFLELLEALIKNNTEQVDTRGIQVQGNCIPLALAHLRPASAVNIQEIGNLQMGV